MAEPPSRIETAARCWPSPATIARDRGRDAGVLGRRGGADADADHHRLEVEREPGRCGRPAQGARRQREREVVVGRRRRTEERRQQRVVRPLSLADREQQVLGRATPRAPSACSSQRVYQVIISRLLEQISRTFARSISECRAAGTAAPAEQRRRLRPPFLFPRASAARDGSPAPSAPFNLGKT